MRGDDLAVLVLVRRLDGDAERAGAGLDRVEVAGQADDVGVDALEPLAEFSGSVPLRVGGDEHDAELVLRRLGQLLLGDGEVVHRQRADVGAVGVAEIDQRRPALGLRAQVVLLAVRVGEDEVGLLERTVEDHRRLVRTGLGGHIRDGLVAVVAGAAGGEAQSGGGEQRGRGIRLLAHRKMSQM
ncbi:hypothetical protein SAV31267_050570 [Streptomyces avermitilis]|uniref:Uncharacterized protein n=1 Tax=Streptomyces avermitilis TaxID=33903 RepID=A0A4D4MTQ5_STRAX|nr:hypothetical protein SAV31267_050570 [Streptomyces avermitilis]